MLTTGFLSIVQESSKRRRFIAGWLFLRHFHDGARNLFPCSGSPELSSFSPAPQREGGPLINMTAKLNGRARSIGEIAQDGPQSGSISDGTVDAPMGPGEVTLMKCHGDSAERGSGASGKASRAVDG